MTSEIDPDLPVHLAGIIPIMFPLGGTTPSSLRKEVARGRLLLMRIAGKDFTTINAVKEMLRICAAPRPPPKPVVDRSQQHSTSLSSAYMLIEQIRTRAKAEALEKKRVRLAACLTEREETQARVKRERKAVVAERRAARKRAQL
jgi:hypothetical protein